MPKRKSKDKGPEDKERKIARYERKLARYREEQCNSNDAPTPDVDPGIDPEIGPEIGPEIDPEIDMDYSLHQASLENEEGAAHAKEGLDRDFLSALGETAGGTQHYSPEIHKEIFEIFNGILMEGIPKQNKEKLLETLLIPSNCKLLDAPKLNTELLAILNNPSKSRDKLLEDRQQEVGLAIGSICEIINSFSKTEFNKLEIVKKLTDVSRILCDLHFQYTEIRRKLVNPFLEKSLADSLKDNRREEFLYSDLDNSVKTYSAMKRAANALKPRTVTGGQAKFTPKNYQQPPRRLHPNQGHPLRGSYRGAYQHRYNPRPQFKPQDNRPAGPPMRGRARYP